MEQMNVKYNQIFWMSNYSIINIYLYPVFDVLETEDDDIEVENVDLRVFIVDGVVGLLEDPLANDNLALILEVGTKSKRGPKPCPSSS